MIPCFKELYRLLLRDTTEKLVLQCRVCLASARVSASISACIVTHEALGIELTQQEDLENEVMENATALYRREQKE